MIEYNNDGKLIVLNGNYDIFNPANFQLPIGKIRIVNGGQVVQFRCSVQSGNIELYKLDKHGQYENGKEGHGGFMIIDDELECIVFKRDFVWQYMVGHRWKILGCYRKTG